ncbi:protein kinase domain-containing protein [Kitasatospora sp. LaBMicrA B282]|uniref:protein kinase domain-containing protein n=1 Tax=Kitasatospora sp. LaBMicrA B282 TaxID=3420949 RepID=UPI003D139AC7
MAAPMEPESAGSGDGGPGPRQLPRTKVDWRRLTRRPGGLEVVSGPPSRLGAVPRPRFAPDAPTRVKPAGTVPLAARPAGGAFPDALRDRFEPQGVAGSGTEGTVWHVRRTDDAGEAAVKVTAAGQAMDAELLTHLRNDGFRRHVPRIVDFGSVAHHGTELDWVAMEYLPVTLADRFAALRRDGRRPSARETGRIVAELVSLLVFWQQEIERNPVDFKPANILVRPAGSAEELVIADFGGVAGLTASRRFSPDMQVTIPYMAPEQLAGTNHPAGPWWALGNVLYELFAGRPRYLDADGRLVSDQELQYDLVMGAEVNLSAVGDHRQRLLLQGLFTKDPAHRWTAAEVTGWLAGGSPEVVRHRPGAGGAPAHRPITFRGAPHHDPSALAAALLGHSADAATWLADGATARLRSWLRDDVKDTVFDLQYLTDVERAPRGTRRETAAALAVLAFGAAFEPSATPHYRGHPIDTAGLEHIAARPGAKDFVDALVAAGAPAVAARYDCSHPECSGEWCSRLLAVADLPQVMATVLAELDRNARALGSGRRGGDGPTPQEQEDAYRLTVRLTVGSAEYGRLVAGLSPLPAAAHRLVLSEPASARLAALAAVVADTVLAAREAVGRRAQGTGRKAPGAGRESVQRRWSMLRRRALDGDPQEVAGRAVLVAAQVLRDRAARAAGSAPGSASGAASRSVGRLDRARRWAATVRPELPARAGAALLMLLGFALLLWAGAVFRYPIDAKLNVWPNGGFGGPLRTAGLRAAHQVAGQLGAAIGAALVLAAFPARVGRGTVTLAGAGAVAIGCLRLGPPLGLLDPPQAVTDRVVLFEGGMGGWAGVAAMVAVVVGLLLNGRAAGKLLRLDSRPGAGTTAGKTAGKTDRTAAGKATEKAARTKRWPDGNAGRRRRLGFALWSTLVLVTLLWAAVEVRLAVTGHHRTPASWGTGQTGASYQAGFVLLLATVAVLGTLATPPTSRALLVGCIPATVFLGAWPGPLGPMEALRIPVLQGPFGTFASVWGHSAFWAALLLALPVAAYGTRTALRLTTARP